MIADKIAARIEVSENGCWIWQGALNSKGYGSVGNGEGSSSLTHRVMYEAHVGPIPEHLQIDHLCRVKACCNPAHLEAVTQQENIRRQVASVSHCKKGHEYTAESMYTHRRSNGATTRECRECHRERMKEWRAAKKLAA